MTAAAALPARHALLGLAVVTVWGSNFVVIEHALRHLPPLTLAALRFALAFAPAALFVARPAVPWRTLMMYGLLIGAGQFGLLFVAMTHHITPGLASVVVQMQVFFTIGIAVARGQERLRPVQAVALAMAGAGLMVIATHTDGQTTPLGLALVVGAALAWALGNHVGRSAGRVDMLGFVVWSSAFAVPPLAVLSLWLEGPAAVATGLRSAEWSTWAAVAWQTVGNTWFGYGCWGWLMARHPAATVAPLALGVPVVGLAASALWLDEPLPGWKLIAAGLVIGGLALGMARTGSRRRADGCGHDAGSSVAFVHSDGVQAGDAPRRGDTDARYADTRRRHRRTGHGAAAE